MRQPHEPIDRLAISAETLMAEYPPVLRDRNKRLVFEIACPAGSQHAGVLEYSRWKGIPLPDYIIGGFDSTSLATRDGFYDYCSALAVSGGVEWHVNFADPHLFVAYGSSLLAQDEMQVAEHPALGALREALQAQGLSALTVRDSAPTPILVTGVERRCRVATDANPAEGRPQGLYENAFARADPEGVRRATSRIDPPTIANLIAMAAPAGGYGHYTPAQIEHVLTTAYSAFHAAALESARLRGAPCQVVIHTGHWGGGAFGGNRVLMAAIQIVAARLARIDRLVFHTGDDDRSLQEGRQVVEEELTNEGGSSTRAFIENMTARRFRWGVSDGN